MTYSKDGPLSPTAQPRPLARFDQAVAILQRAGISLPASRTDEKPVVSLLRELAPLGEAEVAVIAKTLASLEDFNELVRNKIVTDNVGSAYADIANMFDSIRHESKVQIEQMEDGRLDLTERLRNAWTRFRHGSIPDRFQKIRKQADVVFRSTEKQLSGEKATWEAYSVVRIGVKEAGVVAFGLRDRAQSLVDAARRELSKAKDAVEAITDDDSARAQAEVLRDEAVNRLYQAERRYQVALDLANNLSIAYNTGEVVMSRLAQVSEAKHRVLQQSVSFMSTNDGVITALAATMVSSMSLHANSETLKQLEDGTNASLEVLTDVGGKVQERAVRIGHGPTIRADILARLIDSIVDAQANSRVYAEEERQRAIANEKEIRLAVEDGKRRLAEIALRGDQPAFVPAPAMLVDRTES